MAADRLAAQGPDHAMACGWSVCEHCLDGIYSLAEDLKNGPRYSECYPYMGAVCGWSNADAHRPSQGP
jgi:hypothetical protein